MAKSKENKGKYIALTKNTVLFTISSFGSKMISFLLVPLYTYILSTSEFGTVDLMSSTASLLIPLITVNIQDAVMRYTLDKNYDSEDVINVGIKVNLIGNIVLIISLFLIQRVGIINLELRYLLFLYTSFLFGALNNCLTMYLKAIDKVSIIVVSGLLNTGITCLLNLLLLLVFKIGINGYLIANVLGMMIATLYSFFIGKIYKYIKIFSSKKILKDMIIYSLPLVINSMAWWINNASDRYILVFFCGVATNGIYSVSYKIPTVLSTIQGIFYNAWSISAITEFDKDDTDGFIGNIYSTYSILILLACSVLILINIPLARILYSKEFFSAWLYVPFLLVGTAFNGLALFEGCIFTAVKQTKEVSKTTISGALVNTICNFVCIYLWGAIGAAFATMIGYIVTWSMRTIKLKTIVNMKISWKLHIFSYLLLIAQSIIALMGNLWWIEIIFFIAIFTSHKNKIKSIAYKIFRK